MPWGAHLCGPFVYLAAPLQACRKEHRAVLEHVCGALFTPTSSQFPYEVEFAQPPTNL